MKTKLNPKEFCEKHSACADGAAFAVKYATMAEVWDNCPRVDWLCWILERLNVDPDEKRIREYMCWAATETPLHDGRKTLDLLTDERSRNAVNVALRFARDEANTDELDAAWSAAESAARSAARSATRSAAESAAESAAWSAAWSAAESAAWSAAESAAWSAAESAAWSATRSAARSATRSAAWSAAESAAWSAAWSAARSAAESAQVKHFRAMFLNPFRD